MELERCCKEEWAKLAKDRCAKLVKSYSARLEAVIAAKAEKYDPRDVEKLQKDDDLVHNYLQWRLFNMDDTLKMIDESFQWRKEYRVNDLTENDIPTWMFDTGAVYLHGYDKEGNKLFWFRVKMHVKDAKTASDKKRYVAFWLERYARREPGMPLTVVFDMTESGITNIVSMAGFVWGVFPLFFLSRYFHK
uniref:CRAL-TRIO domain-containing protein n=1 Tax=Erpetoichthys calabaricus TaxID=27687 RepID=A0A8C4SK72_ERPCA